MNEGVNCVNGVNEGSVVQTKDAINSPINLSKVESNAVNNSNHLPNDDYAQTPVTNSLKQSFTKLTQQDSIHGDANSNQAKDKIDIDIAIDTDLTDNSKNDTLLKPNGENANSSQENCETNYLTD